MPRSSVLVSSVESGNQLAHTDTSTAPHALQPSDRAKADRHLSTFVALSPRVRREPSGGKGFRGGQGGEVGRGPTQRRGGPHHGKHHLPTCPPPAKTCQRPCSPSGPSTRGMHVWCPTPPSLAPPLTCVDQRDFPIYGKLLFGGGGLEAHSGLAVEELRDDVFMPPPPPTLRHT